MTPPSMGPGPSPSTTATPPPPHGALYQAGANAYGNNPHIHNATPSTNAPGGGAVPMGHVQPGNAAGATGGYAAQPVSSSVSAMPALGGQGFDDIQAYWIRNVIDGRPIIDAIRDAANQYGIDPRLLASVIDAESGGDPYSLSRTGARGLMQIEPGTWDDNNRRLAERGAAIYTNPHDVRENIMSGASQLSRLLTKYNGNVNLALAAYNAGEGNVHKYGGIPPFDETRGYIKKIDGFLGSSYSPTYNGRVSNAVPGWVAGPQPPSAIPGVFHPQPNGATPAPNYHKYPGMFGYTIQPVPGHQDKVFNSSGQQVDLQQYRNWRGQMVQSQENGAAPPLPPKPYSHPTATPALPGWRPPTKPAAMPGANNDSHTVPWASAAAQASGTGKMVLAHAFDNIVTPPHEPSCAFFASEVLRRAGAPIPPGGIGGAENLMNWAIHHGATPHSVDDAKPGDLLVYQGSGFGAIQANGKRSGYHVGIYLGGGYTIDSSKGKINSPYRVHLGRGQHITAFTVP